MPADNRCDCPIPWIEIRENPILGTRIEYRKCCFYEEMAKLLPPKPGCDYITVVESDPTEAWDRDFPMPGWMVVRHTNKRAKGFKMLDKPAPHVPDVAPDAPAGV